MPKEQELKTMFDALLTNGLDFLERSIGDIGSNPALSVAHFAVGLELTLKARLFHEHWALVATMPHNTSWASFKSGSASTISANALVSALEALTETRMNAEVKIFKSVFDHRYRMLHFVPSVSIQAVAAEQFRSWYYLHGLLTGAWNKPFESHALRIASLDLSFRKHTAYLGIRFDELTKANKFLGPAHNGALIECAICKFKSGILADPDEALTRLECPVCFTEVEVADFGCGVWHDLSNGLYGEVACRCGEKHSPADLAGLVNDTPGMSPKEASMVGDTRLHCGECLQYRSVAPLNGSLRCMGCNTEFEESDQASCGWCSESWAGYDCSDTYLTGCEFCDGHPEFNSND
jgi:hypothetical protein